MAFTYDLSNAIGKVRLELGDTVALTVSPAQGVRPNGDNLSDEEITYLLGLEGNDVMRAVARACEMLSRQWATAVDLSLGPRSESFGAVAARWESRARTLRDQHGFTSSTGQAAGAHVVTFGRDDDQVYGFARPRPASHG